MIREALEKVVNGENLTSQEAYEVMLEMMSDDSSQMLTASYLTALRMKGETIDEITGSAKGMRERAIRILDDEEVLEIVGTGGDKANSFNISTASSLVVAAYGIPVAKHGNRSVSSKCGAADVLEALGANISMTPIRCTEVLKETDFTFMFAQVYHSAMRFVGPVRKELGLRTIFNILGPLTNPAGACYQLMGVYSADLVEPMAQVLMNLGVKSGMVVYGEDCLDEISLSAKTKCCAFHNGEMESFTFDPTEYGFTMCTKEDLVGGDPTENAQIIKDIFDGVKGPKRDAVVLNSAACIYMIEEGTSMAEAIKKAQDVIDSGKAKAKLEEFVAATNK